MLHLIRYAAGIVTGVVAVKLLNNPNMQKTLHKIPEKMRSATVSGLSAVEKAAAKARAKFSETEESETPANEAEQAPKS